MRLSKRQLKRIIREEYSRLKRRGLIREMGFDPSDMGEEVEYYCEQIVEELYGGELSYDELSDSLSGIIPDFDEALLGNAIDQCIERGMIEALIGEDGLGVFSVSPDYM